MHRSKFRNVVVLVVALAGIPASAGAQPAPPTDGRAEMAATLVRLLGDPDPMVRKYARDALTVTRPTEAVPLLVPLLNDGNPERVGFAISILAEIPSADARNALVKLAEDKKGDFRLKVAQALTARREMGAEVLRFYQNLSRDPDPQLRVIAIAALGNRLLPPNSPIWLPAEGFSLNAGRPLR